MTRFVMRSLRAILAVFIALLIVFSTNRCVVAASVEGEVEHCCEAQTPGTESERGLPANGMDCAPCLTLESGVNLAALVPLAVPAPVWAEDREIAEFLQLLTAMEADVAPAAPPDPATMPAPLWNVVMKKALPVRGPSLAV